MKENNRFYTIAESPTEIVRRKDSRYFIQKRDWDYVKANVREYKVFFLDLDVNETRIEEVPREFLFLEDEQFEWHGKTKYETSENYTIHGQFTTSELSWRAHKRLFNWGMYVYRLPRFPINMQDWTSARDVPVVREILEKHFPLKVGDTGPAGGIIFQCDTAFCEHGYHCIEAAPFDAGWATWQDALRLCEDYSINGIDGWRLPSPKELNDFASTKCAQNVYQTTETVINWSNERKGENAIAVITQINEDFYQYPYTYTLGGTSGGSYKNSTGLYRGQSMELPVTHSYPVRPVRDFYAKKIMKGL